MAPETPVEPLTDDPEPLVVDPEETVPPADVPEGGVELMLPDAEGELTLPEPGELTGLLDGELVLSPVPLELVAPVLPLLTEPDAPPLLMEPAGPDVVGDADGV